MLVCWTSRWVPAPLDGSSTAWFTGSVPGMPEQTGQAEVLGAATVLSTTSQEQNILIRLKLAWTSSPMTGSYSMGKKRTGDRVDTRPASSNILQIPPLCAIKLQSPNYLSLIAWLPDHELPISQSTSFPSLPIAQLPDPPTTHVPIYRSTSTLRA
jgi:hypothetical protein